MSECAQGIAEMWMGLCKYICLFLAAVILVSALLGWGLIEGCRYVVKTYDFKIEKVE